ncbi:MAG TPA: hypothetical protein DIU35_19830 [Candidatus Latescibacteria bacterium]|nr:hypothetical protein [Gemmatimonadota bacterium]HCR19732.1 hypothetical protein [Candidatus Latescibacterota bacterium]
MATQDEVGIAVPIQIVLMNPLEDSPARDAKIVSHIAKSTLAECLESNFQTVLFPMSERFWG